MHDMMGIKRKRSGKKNTTTIRNLRNRISHADVVHLNHVYTHLLNFYYDKENVYIYIKIFFIYWNILENYLYLKYLSGK